MASLKSILSYLLGICLSWFGLVLLLLGANDVLKLYWSRWGEFKVHDLLHTNRWRIGIALFVIAQGLAYRDISKQNEALETRVAAMPERQIVVSESPNATLRDENNRLRLDIAAKDQRISELGRDLGAALANIRALQAQQSARMQRDEILKSLSTFLLDAGRLEVLCIRERGSQAVADQFAPWDSSVAKFISDNLGPDVATRYAVAMGNGTQISYPSQGTPVVLLGRIRGRRAFIDNLMKEVRASSNN